MHFMIPQSDIAFLGARLFPYKRAARGKMLKLLSAIIYTVDLH